MEQLSNLNLNSITSSLSEGIKGLMESQDTNELGNEIFGPLSSDTTDKNDANAVNAANSSSSASSSFSSGPIIIMKKKLLFNNISFNTIKYFLFSVLF